MASDPRRAAAAAAAAPKLVEPSLEKINALYATVSTLQDSSDAHLYNNGAIAAFSSSLRAIRGVSTPAHFSAAANLHVVALQLKQNVLRELKRSGGVAVKDDVVRIQAVRFLAKLVLLFDELQAAADLADHPLLPPGAAYAAESLELVAELARALDDSVSGTLMQSCIVQMATLVKLRPEGKYPDCLVPPLLRLFSDPPTAGLREVQQKSVLHTCKLVLKSLEALPALAQWKRSISEALTGATPAAIRNVLPPSVSAEEAAPLTADKRTAEGRLERSKRQKQDEAENNLIRLRESTTRAAAILKNVNEIMRSRGTEASLAAPTFVMLMLKNLPKAPPLKAEGKNPQHALLKIRDAGYSHIAAVSEARGSEEEAKLEEGLWNAESAFNALAATQGGGAAKAQSRDPRAAADPRRRKAEAAPEEEAAPEAAAPAAKKRKKEEAPDVGVKLRVPNSLEESTAGDAWQRLLSQRTSEGLELCGADKLHEALLSRLAAQHELGGELGDPRTWSSHHKQLLGYIKANFRRPLQRADAFAAAAEAGADADNSMAVDMAIGAIATAKVTGASRGAELGLAWLYSEFGAAQQAGGGDGGEDGRYDKIFEVLLTVAAALAEDTEESLARENVMRLLLRCPELTGGVFELVAGWCSTYDKLNLGLDALAKLHSERPSSRQRVLAMLIQQSGEKDVSLRGPAIEVLSGGATGNGVQAAVFSVPSSEAAVLAAARAALKAVEQLEGEALRAMPAGGRGEELKRLLHLPFALCRRRPVLLHAIRDSFARSPRPVQEWLLARPAASAAQEAVGGFGEVISGVGAASADLHAMLRASVSQPEGRKLCVRALEVLARKPAAELAPLVALLRELHRESADAGEHATAYTVQLLGHFLSVLQPEELRPFVPALVALLPYKRKSEGEGEREELQRKRAEDDEVRRAMFLEALARLFGSASCPLMPADFLLELLTLQGKAKQVNTAIKICLGELGNFYSQSVIRSALSKLVNLATLPPLFMALVWAARQQYPDLELFVASSLFPQVIRKHPWASGSSDKNWRMMKKLFAAFANFDAACTGLLQLPTAQLREALNENVELVAVLRAYCAKLRGGTPASVEAVLSDFEAADRSEAAVAEEGGRAE